MNPKLIRTKLEAFSHSGGGKKKSKASAEESGAEAAAPARG
jgi:hypothetical protein